MTSNLSNRTTTNIMKGIKLGMSISNSISPIIGDTASAVLDILITGIAASTLKSSINPLLIILKNH